MSGRWKLLDSGTFLAQLTSHAAAVYRFGAGITLEGRIWQSMGSTGSAGWSTSAWRLCCTVQGDRGQSGQTKFGSSISMQARKSRGGERTYHYWVCSSEEQSVCDSNVGFSKDMCLHRSRLVEFLLLNIGVD
jgi:hypothetical protein